MYELVYLYQAFIFCNYSMYFMLDRVIILFLNLKSYRAQYNYLNKYIIYIKSILAFNIVNRIFDLHKIMTVIVKCFFYFDMGVFQKNNPSQFKTKMSPSIYFPIIIWQSSELPPSREGISHFGAQLQLPRIQMSTIYIYKSWSHTQYLRYRKQ